ncbi:MAG TPA: hypothetical protein VMU89_16400 [Thermomicrobiaceae bacterium]|nr:hypothetical protein [Thermomicrobiaceae bacterium]
MTGQAWRPETDNARELADWIADLIGDGHGLGELPEEVKASMRASEEVRIRLRNSDASPVIVGPTDLRIEDGALVWSDVEWRLVPFEDTAPAAWAFADIADASEEELLRFTEDWGLWRGHYGPGADPVENVIGTAAMIRAWLATFAATLEERLVDEDTLWQLRYGENFGPQRPSYREVAESLPQGRDDLDARRDQVDARRDELWERELRPYWRAERRAGRGIQVQRWILAGFLSVWTSGLEAPLATPYWRDDGRRIRLMPIGVKGIVFTHLLRLFAAPEPNVFTCSECGAVFEWLPATGDPRPRRDRRRFCSDECRLAARRATKRETWHRHKGEWKSRRAAT